MNLSEHPDLFLDNDPELREKYKRANFPVSVLGGNASEDDARKLGYELAKHGFPVVTGGYKMGAMKGALEGANTALEELKKDPASQTFINQIRPKITGITAENFAPYDMAAKGENIDTDVAEGPHDLYLRLGKLTEDSEVAIVLPGDSGTELEVLANMHFNKKLKGQFKVAGVHPMILIGDNFLNLVREKFPKILDGGNCVYKVANTEEAFELTDQLFKQTHGELLSEEEAFATNNSIKSKLLKSNT